jgi:hypothetical protein
MDVTSSEPKRRFFSGLGGPWAFRRCRGDDTDDVLNI